MTEVVMCKYGPLLPSMTRYSQPRTKQMYLFMVREKDRVVGVSYEDDQVFIYTDSAKWCDDSGAGTFIGSSGSDAIRAFYNLVEEGDGTYR